MADKKDKETSKAESDKLESLIAKVDKKKNELQKEREKQNPDGRFTGFQLYNMFVAITGKNPFTGQPVKNVSVKGIGNQRYPNADLFSTKLQTNLKELQENLAVIQQVMPSLDEEQSKTYNKFLEKKKEIIKENTGISNPEGLSDEQIIDVADRKGNKAIYQNAVSELEKEYEKVINIRDQVMDDREEFLKKPLAKCEFDLITKEDVSRAGISVQEQLSIEPMLDF